MHQNFAKIKNVLSTQICIENVKLKKKICNCRISKINSLMCLCKHEKQIIKHIIISCLQYNRNNIKNDRKSIDYKNFVNTTTKLKKFIR